MSSHFKDILFCISSFVGRFHMIEGPLIDWVVQRRGEGALLSGHVIRAKALLIAREISISDFKASAGWLLRFLFRHRLVLRYILYQIFFSICLLFFSIETF
jgi:hypothetical protein